MSDDSSYVTNLLNKLGLSNKTQLFMVALFLVIILNLFYVSDVNVLESKSHAIIITLVTVVVAVSLYKLITGVIGGDKDKFISAFAVLIIFAFLVGGFVVEFFNKYLKQNAMFNRLSSDANGRFITNIIEISLVISIFIVGMSAANNVMGRYLNNSTSWLGFILNFILYIPCLFEDLVKYAKKEYGLTPSVTLILFVIELLLITGYVTLPRVLSSRLKNQGIEVMNEPEFLDIAINKTFNNEDVGEHDNKRTNYAFSMWVYMNQQNKSSGSNHIFSYANSYPKIEYIKCKGEPNKDKYRFTVNKDTYDISLPNQKWNSIVVNFNDNDTVDIFVNGNLERTFKISDRKITSNSRINYINIGGNDGLYGAICNVNYYQNPLTQGQIVEQYNLLYNKNPPINNIV